MPNDRADWEAQIHRICGSKPHKKRVEKMSESKHTPGPWYFKAQDWTIRVKEWSNCRMMGDNSGCIICDLKPAHGGNAHAFSAAEANARLIAAAPTLLSLLERVGDLEAHYGNASDEIINLCHEVRRFLLDNNLVTPLEATE